MTRRALRFELGAVGVTAGLYLVNRLVLLRVARGALLLFFQWYFADILAGGMILGITNLLLLLARLNWRLGTPGKIVPFLLLCGLAWEVLPLYYKAGAVFDWYDILCYLIGGGVYYLLSRFLMPWDAASRTPSE